METIPLSTDIAVEADQPPSALWSAIATSDGFRQHLVAAVRDLLTGKHHTRRVQALVDAGVTAVDGGVARLLAGLERPPEDWAHQRALNLVDGWIQDGMTVLGHLDVDELCDGPLPVFREAEYIPTIAVRVGPDFRDRRRKQRETVCRIISALSKYCDIRIVTMQVTAKWLANNHHEQLPCSFSEQVTATPSSTDIDELVTAARDQFHPDERAIKVLRRIRSEPTDTISYDTLVANFQVTQSRISQILGQLEAFDLAERVGSRGDTRIELRPAGDAFLDSLDRVIGRQASLDEVFSTCSRSADEGVSNAGAREGSCTPAGGGGSRVRCPTPHQVRWGVKRADKTAITAAAPENGIGLVDHPVDRWDDRNSPVVDYDEERDAVIVAEEYDNPMSSVTTLAHGLTHPRLWGRINLEDRLRDSDTAFSDLFPEHRDILRQSRCLGWLSDRIQSPVDLLEKFDAARENLLEMTRELRDEEYHDRTAFRTEILRNALGLCGAITHVLDLAGFDVIRVLRVPRLDDPDSFGSNERSELAKRVAMQAAIESRYRQATAYRVIFEDRDEKRRWTIFPTVDASDPCGQLIGRFVIVGKGVDEFEDTLRRHLAQPGGQDVVDDAPEFAVRIPITEPDRSAYSTAVQRTLRLNHRNLNLTKEAITIIRALTGSILDAVRAIEYLGDAKKPRDIRLDEVRVALSLYAKHDDAGRLLPDTKPSVSILVATLLRLDAPLRQTELADESDLAKSTVSTHIPKLEALGLVQEVPGGWRMTLPFDTNDEHGADEVLPFVAEENTDAREPLFDLLIAELGIEEAGRLADPDDPLGAAMYWPPDYERIREECPSLQPWITIAMRLCGESTPTVTEVSFGRKPDQSSIQTAVAGGE